MTAAQAIAQLDALTPNTYDQPQKLLWLARAEAGLLPEQGKQAALEADTLLQAGEPYDELYIRYMQAQIFLEAGEITRYNNAMALYNNALAQFRRAHIRENTAPAFHLHQL